MSRDQATRVIHAYSLHLVRACVTFILHCVVLQCSVVCFFLSLTREREREREKKIEKNSGEFERKTCLINICSIAWDCSISVDFRKVVFIFDTWKPRLNGRAELQSGDTLSHLTKEREAFTLLREISKGGFLFPRKTSFVRSLINLTRPRFFFLLRISV